MIVFVVWCFSMFLLQKLKFKAPSKIFCLFVYLPKLFFFLLFQNFTSIVEIVKEVKIVNLYNLGRPSKNAEIKISHPNADWEIC